VSADFRIREIFRSADRCGHVVEGRVCEELVEGRWEPFVSGGVCVKCRREAK
jgi:hypothetical protein